jgi:hypothetical protein
VSTSRQAWKNNDPTYKVTVNWTRSGRLGELPNPRSKDSNPTVVQAYVPEEELVLQFGGRWAAPFADAGNLVGGGTGVKAAAGVFGVALSDARLTSLVWQGMDTPTISLNLDFFAEEDARLDVVEPMVALARMALPRVSDLGTGIVAPGPSIGGQLAASLADFARLTKGAKTDDNRQIGERIWLSIGKNMFWPLVVLESVTLYLPLYKADKDGRYVHGRARCQFKPFRAPFRDDLDQMFGIS